MYRLSVDPPWSLEAWRALARRALLAGVPPDRLDWDDANAGSLLGDASLPGPVVDAAGPGVPRAFLALAAKVLAHRDPQRHALLYRLLWRLTHGEPGLLGDVADVDVHRAAQMEKAVRRDVHKMKAFVRFRQVPGSDDSYVAWFEPEHHILDLVAPFFMRRFTGMRWAILTPYRSARWDRSMLHFSQGGLRSDAPADDAQEALWQAYYANIFNPARINPRMMRQEMPQKYWKHLPEAQLLPGLLLGAGARVRDMAERAPQPPRRRIPAVPSRPADVPGTHLPGGLAELRGAARDCRRCPLWKPATQTVLGEGPSDASIMLVGEQPGDEEDLSGRPFVGPAGRLLDRAMDELGLSRQAMYVTNAVKHFKFEQRGKRRIHQKPNAGERHACAAWLAEEFAAIRPDTVVCLGATAAQAVFGSGFRLKDGRGQWQELESREPGRRVRALATVHPAWVLRQTDPGARENGYRLLVQDLGLLCSVRPSSI
ncbi:MAG: UdgX family uracil-DNA binding protein [Pseudomonadota bacterium]|nr:UdgX family uracil-DNA binding protein [Pseudomonadota bacterium]